MILVLGTVHVQAGKLEEALAVSQQHVQRSRAEPGCVEHGVSISADSPLQLVFVERWHSMAALQQHFGVAATRQFAAAMAKLASAPPQVAIYDAREVKFGGAA